MLVSCKSMGPTGEDPGASKLHGAYDDQYLLRLVSQEGKPGIFAFETCLHDQGVARQGMCVSALRNLKGEPVPISIEVIASEQLSREETEILAAVKREHQQYTSALAARAKQQRKNDIRAGAVAAPVLVGGGTILGHYSDQAVKSAEASFSRSRYGEGEIREDIRIKTRELDDAKNRLAYNSEAFEQFLATSEGHLKHEAARLSEFLGKYNDFLRIDELRQQIKYVNFATVIERYNANPSMSMFDQEMVEWLDETGLPGSLRTLLQDKGLSIDEYLRKPSAFDSLIADYYGNNKQAFDELVVSAMRRWQSTDPASRSYLKLGPLYRKMGGSNIVFDGSTADLRRAIERFDTFRFEYPSRFKTQDSYKAMLSNYELNAVRIDSYERLQAINQLFDDVAKGVRSKELLNKDIVKLMAWSNQPKGEKILGKVEDLQVRISRLNNEMLYRGERIAAARHSQLGFLRNSRIAKMGRAAGIVAIGLGFGALARAVYSHNATADDHGDDWQALLESGQVDLITDFSSSLWTPDATDHAAVPSVKELMVHITLFQRELWFGQTSDAPDVVQIVKHCLPDKSRGGIKAKCESVVGM